MKKTYFSLLTVLLLSATCFINQGFAQAFNSLDDAPHDISYYRESRVMPPMVKVLYGRPIKDSEEVFGNKIPYGKIWRTGANEATEVKFYKEVQFGETKVAAGTYVLLTIPGEKEWEVILSSQTDVLGAFQYEPSYDVARIKVPVQKAETLEAFSIAFKKADNILQMVLGWDATRIKIPLQFTEESAVVKR